MLADWTALSDDLQLHLSRCALRHAAEVIAGQAEELASEMDFGVLPDRGGAEALRLLAELVRAVNGEGFAASPAAHSGRTSGARSRVAASGYAC